ncbi:response regulator transcription factor [Streptomyces mirabilis]|uniref:hypothetical protein n=1 Tax=Streptomyces mirabilis TaxID=68239 RepID=UPI00367DDDC8
MADRPRSAPPEDLLSSIRTVAAGDSLLSPTATRALIPRFLAAPDTDGFLALPEVVRALTDREREVTALAAYCKSNTGIAEQLVLSPWAATPARASTAFKKAGLKVTCSAGRPGVDRTVRSASS